MSVRVRYAPSPTGSPHVGNIRTALFDYLLAQRFGGTMIVRLEDTDRNRTIPGCEDEILESLRWIGVKWSEGPDIGGPHAPYRQSERAELGIYRAQVDRLIAAGHAYWAFDTPEELEEMRLTQQVNKLQVGYFGGHWREAAPTAVEQAHLDGKPGVIRLRMPRGRKLIVQDAVRGRVEFDSDTVDDPVLLKADGMPTYHCAAMIDDHLMDISHIIRGEEWISSAPKHVWLFEALGWTPPEFVHVPVILGKDGKKLSKRHGDTRCLDYRDGGYLHEALANFIALIGWAPGGDRELMTMQEMGEAFDLGGLQPSPGVFDKEKLDWMNGQYLRGLEIGELVGRVKQYLHRPETADYWLKPEHEAQHGAALQLLENSLDKDESYVAQAIKLEQPRVTTLAEFGEACAFFLQDEPPMDEAAVAKWFGEPHVKGLFEDLAAWLGTSFAPGESENEEEKSVPGSPYLSLLSENEERAGPGSPSSSLRSENEERAGPNSPSSSLRSENEERAGPNSPSSFLRSENEEGAGPNSPSSFLRSENEEGAGGWRSGPPAPELEAFLRSWAESHGFEKLGPIVHPARVALTGKTTGPGLFELMEVLGPERMIRRLKRAMERLR